MKDVLVEEVNNFYRGALTHKIEDSAEIYLSTRVKEITDAGVLCQRDGQELLIEADSVRLMIRWTNWRSWWMNIISLATAAMWGRSTMP